MSQNPYQDYGQFSPPPKQDSTMKIVLIVLLAVGVGGLLTCAGFMGLTFYAFIQVQNELENFDLDLDEFDYEMEEFALADAVGESPELQAEVGKVVYISIDLDKTETETAHGDSFYWYKVEGVEASGELYVEHCEDDSGWFNSAELVLDNGRRVPLTLSPVPYDDIDEREVYLQIKDNKKLRAAIGEINAVIWDSDKLGTDDDNSTYFYKIVGSDAEANVRTDESDGVVVTQIELSDGTEIPTGG